MSFNVSDDYEEGAEPLVYLLDSHALQSSAVKWGDILAWVISKKEITCTQNYNEFYTAIEFPTRELMLEFLTMFPGLLKGEE